MQLIPKIWKCFSTFLCNIRFLLFLHMDKVKSIAWEHYFYTSQQVWLPICKYCANKEAGWGEGSKYFHLCMFMQQKNGWFNSFNHITFLAEATQHWGLLKKISSSIVTLGTTESELSSYCSAKPISGLHVLCCSKSTV